MDNSSFFIASTWIIPIILAITLHEAAHGWVAERFGDDTARKLGRVTFNPLKHIDPMGTVIIPALLLLIRSPILFGYAKPVPVDFDRLQPPRLGMFSVAIAGVAANMLMAATSALLLHFGNGTSPETMAWWELNCYHAVLINCVLALFNMIPILPIDGGRALRALLPGKLGELYAKTERIGLPIILMVLILPPFFGFTVIIEAFMHTSLGLVDSLLTLTGHDMPKLNKG